MPWDSSSGPLVVDGGLLNLNGFSITVGSLSGTGGTIANNLVSTASTLSVAEAGSSSYEGDIQNGSGTVTFVVNGSGDLALGGDNTYSAGTTVVNGTLAAVSPAAIADTALVIGAGGTFVFDPEYSAGPDVVLQQASGQAQSASGMADSGDRRPLDPPPVVTAITCAGQSGPVVDADSLAFQVKFNKPVVGVTVAAFSVLGMPGTVSSVTGSGCQYIVSVDDLTGSGPVALAVVSRAAITDLLGTPLAAATIPVHQQYLIDRELFWAGSSGTWDTGMNWCVGSPSGPRQGWVDGSSAVYDDGSGTVQVVNPVDVVSMTFSGEWTIEGATITLSDGSNLSVSAWNDSH